MTAFIINRGKNRIGRKKRDRTANKETRSTAAYRFAALDGTYAFRGRNTIVQFRPVGY